MASFFDDPDSDHEESYGRSAQPRASSSRAHSTTNESIAPTSPSTRSRTFSLVPGTDDDLSLRDGAHGGSDIDLDLLDGGGEEDNDVKRLGRAWVKERGTGDIMPWEGDLIDQLFDKLEQQVSHSQRAEVDSTEYVRPVLIPATGEDGQYTTGGSTDVGGGTLQVDVGPNGDGEGEVPRQELRPHETT